MFAASVPARVCTSSLVRRDRDGGGKKVLEFCRDGSGSRPEHWGGGSGEGERGVVVGASSRVINWCDNRLYVFLKLCAGTLSEVFFLLFKWCTQQHKMRMPRSTG